ncbi:hypothetical protein SDC9_112628 [bioreactor metagenome]|uniref:Uncharacterized protein n=1 Tax=bioreactor metagenome TaxID=1076179 RepID=A0A645BKV2_9ZZZZ
MTGKVFDIVDSGVKGRDDEMGGQRSKQAAHFRECLLAFAQVFADVSVVGDGGFDGGDVHVAALEQRKVFAGALCGFKDDFYAGKVCVDDVRDAADIDVLAAAGSAGAGRNLDIFKYGVAGGFRSGGGFRSIGFAAAGTQGDHANQSENECDDGLFHTGPPLLIFLISRLPVPYQ